MPDFSLKTMYFGYRNCSARKLPCINSQNLLYYLQAGTKYAVYQTLFRNYGRRPRARRRKSTQPRQIDARRICCAQRVLCNNRCLSVFGERSTRHRKRHRKRDCVGTGTHHRNSGRARAVADRYRRSPFQCNRRRPGGCQFRRATGYVPQRHQRDAFGCCEGVLGIPPVFTCNRLSANTRHLR